LITLVPSGKIVVVVTAHADGLVVVPVFAYQASYVYHVINFTKLDNVRDESDVHDKLSVNTKVYVVEAKLCL
jgi:hypothetical protein